MRLVRALVPGLLVALGAASLYATVPGRLDWLVGTYGIVVYLGGLALAWVFHRSRAFIVLAVVGWLDVFVVGGESESRIYELLGPWVVEAGSRPAVALFVGTTVLGLLGLLAVFRDRGVSSRVGFLQLVAAAGMMAAAAFAATDRGRMAELASDAEIQPLIQMTALGFPRVTVFLALLVACALGYALYRYRGPIERGLLWTALFLLAAMHDAVAVEHASLFLMAAGLTMTLAVVETSYVLAYRDELTGLPGRRALMQYLDGLQGTYTAAMVDVDHFKKFNDRHGHDVGDQVLKLVASRLGKAPGGGKAYRYGGEEFTLLFPGREKEDAVKHLESVRKSVEDARFTLRSWRRPRKKPDGGRKRKKGSPKKLSVTVSIGVADSGDAGSHDAVLKKADEALYRAKKKGRNRVAS